jgi:CelD/BcsL family acetyltransferase involved in cellulose biosynthesis
VIDVRVMTSIEELAPVVPAWDALAVERASPRSAPAPTLAFLRHAAPRRSRARVVVATQGDGTVAGVLALVERRDRFGFVHYDLPGAGVLFGIEPIAGARDPEAVTSAIAARVAELHPAPDTIAIGAMRLGSGWPEALADAFGRRFERVRAGTFRTCAVDLSDGFEGWLGRRTTHFVSEWRRRARGLDRCGFSDHEWCEAGEIVPRLPAVWEMQRARLAVRGGEGYRFDEGMGAFAADLAQAYSGSGRLRMVAIERDGRMAGGGLVLAAGGTASSWLSFFDERWQRFSPAIHAIVLSVRLAAERGERLFDLGAGDEAYKRSLADFDGEQAWARWQRRGLWPLHTPAALVPRHSRTRARELFSARTAATAGHRAAAAGGRAQPLNAVAKAASELGAEEDGSGLEP